MIKQGPFTMYYDAGCPFCIRMIRIFRAMLRLPGSIYLRAQSYPERHQEMRDAKSWIVVTASGEHLYGMRAVAAVFSDSQLLSPLGRLIGSRWFLPIGEALYRWIERNRPLLSKLTGFLGDKEPEN